MTVHKRCTVLTAMITVAITALLTACSPEEERETEPDAASQEASAQDSGVHGGNGSESRGSVSKEEAGKISTDKYGGAVEEVGSDSYQGKDVWEVEIRDSDQGRIEIKVEKATGKILNMEKDDG